MLFSQSNVCWHMSPTLKIVLAAVVIMNLVGMTIAAYYILKRK